jgi:DGQHR domain-containing protein
MEYTEFKYEEVNQITRGKMGIAIVKFSDLKSIVRFTARAEEKSDPLSSLVEIENIEKDNIRFYQRVVADKRTYRIQQFIIKEALKEYKLKKGLSRIPSLGLFPTSTLIAVNIFKAENKEEYENEYYNYEKDAGNQITLCFQKDNVIYIPKNNEIALVVDGQHRIAALRDLLLKVNHGLKFGRKNVLEIVDESFLNFLRDRIENFEFLCTLLIDFNIYEQGEIFASVNFNQKPVDRSLYYDIFGSSPNTEKNELKLSHNLVSHLNYNDESVLKGLIDMLGNGEGVVSQSAVMENLMKLFGKGKCWNHLYMDYRSDGERYKTIGLFLRLYFAQIKDTFNVFWPKNNNPKESSILIKTTGMGAFIRLINDIYKDINPNHDKNKKEIEIDLINVFDKIKEKGNFYFNKDSSFIKGAGQGLQSKLYKRISYDLGYRSSPD